MLDNDPLIKMVAVTPVGRMEGEKGAAMAKKPVLITRSSKKRWSDLTDEEVQALAAKIHRKMVEQLPSGPKGERGPGSQHLHG